MTSEEPSDLGIVKIFLEIYPFFKQGPERHKSIIYCRSLAERAYEEIQNMNNEIWAQVFLACLKNRLQNLESYIRCISLAKADAARALDVIGER